MMVEFYKHLYSMEDSTHMPLNTIIRFAGISQAEVEKLNSTVSYMEVRKAIFNMRANKASRSDRFLTLFYQINWNKVGKNLYKLIKLVFEDKMDL